MSDARQDCSTALADLKCKKAETIALVAALPAAQRTFRPATDSWCALEVIDHLFKTEAAILDFMRAGLLKPHRIGIRDRLGFLFIDYVFRSDQKVKVPKSVSAVLPDRETDFERVQERWAQTRVELARTIETLTPLQFGKGIFRHSVAGWMSPLQVLRFFSVHMVHHGHQLARLRSAAKLSV